MSRWTCGTILVAGMALLVAACGGGGSERVAGPKLSGTYSVDAADGQALPFILEQPALGGSRRLVSATIETLHDSTVRDVRVISDYSSSGQPVGSPYTYDTERTLVVRDTLVILTRTLNGVAIVDSGRVVGTGFTITVAQVEPGHSRRTVLQYRPS